MLLQIPGITTALPDAVPTPKEELSMLKSLPFDEFVSHFVSSAVNFAINLAVAIVVFYLGRFIIRKIFGVLSRMFIRRNLDASLSTFVLSMTNIVLYFILIVTVIGILGIETSSFLALFASAGVAIGMALSGTLQNFAGGVLILLLKPYKIGDYIEAQGYTGTVREIQIFHTVICTADNKSISIPNGGLSTGAINNWSREDFRRVDWMVSIAYGDNIDAARTKILEILAADPRVVETNFADFRERTGTQLRSISPTVQVNNIEHADRTPAVNVAELAESSVNLKVTAWVPSSDYWSVFFAINERIYKELPAAGVNFPFPQLDVHLNTVQNNA